MKTGDIVRDGRGRSFQVGPLLGRGLWGRSFSAREENGGADWVIKIAHGPSELPGQDDLVSQCREILLEQARLLEGAAGQGLIALDSRLSLPDGSPALLFPKAAASLDRRVAGGCTVEELLTITASVVRALRALEEQAPFHGNLRPTNVLLDSQGTVFLSDPVTPAFRAALPALLAAAGGHQPYLAPEVRTAPSSPPLGPPTDAYAIAMALYRGAMTNPGQPAERFPDLPDEGLDKSRLVTLKDRVINRLKRENSNPRFHTRLGDRLSALLNRALSRETSPSPPYRFRRLDELLGRIEEIQALVHPTVTHVGRLIIDQKPGSEGFTTDDQPTFSTAVACSPGVETHEEIACGLAFFDAEKDERLRNVNCAYSVDRHPSGRFRFGFKITDLGPGSYRVRVAFTIRESGDEPATAEGTFRIRPAAGYVPPKPEPRSTAIPIDRSEDDAPPTDALRKVKHEAPPRPELKVELRPDPARSVTMGQVVTLHPTLEDESPTQQLSAMPNPTPIAPTDPDAVVSRAQGRGEPARGATPTRLPPSNPASNPANRSANGSAGPAAHKAPVLTVAPVPPKTGPLTNPGPQKGVSTPPPAPPSAPRPSPPRATATATATATGAATAAAPNRPPAAPTAPARRPEPPPPEEPDFKGAGRWSELPLPSAGRDDLPPARLDRPRTTAPVLTTPVEEEVDENDAASAGPVAAAISRAISAIRGDAFILFLVIAIVLCIILALILGFLT